MGRREYYIIGSTGSKYETELEPTPVAQLNHKWCSSGILKQVVGQTVSAHSRMNADSPVIPVNRAVHAALCILDQVLRSRAPTRQTYDGWDGLMVSKDDGNHLYLITWEHWQVWWLTKFICPCCNVGRDVSRDLSDIWEGRVNEPLVKILLCDLLSQSLRCSREGMDQIQFAGLAHSTISRRPKVCVYQFHVN